MVIHPGLAAWDEPLGASETTSRCNRVREDGRSASSEGPLTRRLSTLYWSKREAGWHATPVDYDRRDQVLDS